MFLICRVTFQELTLTCTVFSLIRFQVTCGKVLPQTQSVPLEDTCFLEYRQAMLQASRTVYCCQRKQIRSKVELLWAIRSMRKWWLSQESRTLLIVSISYEYLIQSYTHITYLYIHILSLPFHWLFWWESDGGSRISQVAAWGRCIVLNGGKLRSNPGLKRRDMTWYAIRGIDHVGMHQCQILQSQKIPKVGLWWWPCQPRQFCSFLDVNYFLSEINLL